MVPSELVIDSFLAECAHMVTPHWIIQKLQYLVAELRSIRIPYIQRCLSSRNAPFGEVKLDDRLTQGHVLHDLDHR